MARRSKLGRFLAIPALLAVSFTPAGAQAGPPAPAESKTALRSAYRLGTEDQISIQVPDVEEIADKPVRIDPSGLRQAPLDRPFPGGGLQRRTIGKGDRLPAEAIH